MVGRARGKPTIPAADPSRTHRVFIRGPLIQDALMGPLGARGRGPRGVPKAIGGASQGSREVPCSDLAHVAAKHKADGKRGGLTEGPSW